MCCIKKNNAYRYSGPMLPSSNYRRILEDWLHIKGISAKMMEFGTLEGILGCIHAGLGVSLLPRSVIERAMMKYNVYHHSISDELLRTPTVFIRRKDTFKTAAVSEFIRISRERFNDNLINKT